MKYIRNDQSKTCLYLNNKILDIQDTELLQQIKKVEKNSSDSFGN